MSDQGAAVKLAAVERVVERLLREESEHDASCPLPRCDATVRIAPLASELRAILDAAWPPGETPLQVALAELAEWSQRHRKADPTLLAGAMLAEVIAMQRHQQGAAWGDFVSQAFNLWNASEEEDQGDG